MTLGVPTALVGTNMVGLPGGEIERGAQARDFDVVLERSGQTPRFVPSIEIEGVENNTVWLRVRTADVPNHDLDRGHHRDEEWPGMTLGGFP